MLLRYLLQTGSTRWHTDGQCTFKGPAVDAPGSAAGRSAPLRQPDGAAGTFVIPEEPGQQRPASACRAMPGDRTGYHARLRTGVCPSLLLATVYCG